MNEDDAFIAAIREDPTDDARRLVYADFLQERDDPRGEYIRLVADLTGRPSEDDEAAKLADRLMDIADTLDSEWREAVGKRFDVVLLKIGENKLAAIKAIRITTKLGLREAKDLAESVPSIVGRSLLREAAEAMYATLKDGSVVSPFFQYPPKRSTRIVSPFVIEIREAK